MKNDNNTINQLLIKIERLNTKISLQEKDILVYKRTEDTLAESEEKYRALVENLNDSIFMIDSEMRVAFVNDYAATQFNTKKESIIGKRVSELFPVQSSQRQINSIKQVFADGQMLQAESVYKFPIGEVWLNTKLIPVFNDKRKVKFVYGVSRDISEHKQAEEKLISRNKELETWAEVTSGRELFMLNLKKEINELLEKSGKKPKYKIPI